MKFPSLKNLTENAVITIKRFPCESAFALAGTISATILINRDYLSADSIYLTI